MVMTHKNMQKQTKIGIPVKEDDPSRKFMSKADAVLKNAKLKEDRLKMDRFAAELREKRNAEAGDGAVVAPPSQEVAPDKTVSELAKLEEQLANESGPGSNHRKKKIQAKIDELKA